MPRLGLAAPFRGGTVQDVARIMVRLAREGLSRRGQRDSSGEDESQFLETLTEIAESGRTPAETLLVVDGTTGTEYRPAPLGGGEAKGTLWTSDELLTDPEVLARAWHAQQRLCTKFRRLAARKNAAKLVAVAVARELAGFCWAEMTA